MLTSVTLLALVQFVVLVLKLDCVHSDHAANTLIVPQCYYPVSEWCNVALQANQSVGQFSILLLH